MVDKKFQEALEQENLTVIRDMLKNRLLMDHNVTDGMFNECWKECRQRGMTERIYQEHDGRPLSDERNESNLNSLIGQLATNFSRERLDRVISLAKVVWAGEQGSSISQPKSSVSSETSYQSSSGVGKERIIGERIISEHEVGRGSSRTTSSGARETIIPGSERVRELGSDETESSSSNSRRNSINSNRGSYSSSQESESSIGKMVAVAAVAAIAIIAGVLIFS